MQIRKKLTYRFISIVAIILLSSLITIYWSSANYRKDGFYERLINKAKNTAKLLIEVEEVDAALLHKIETDNPTSLPEEKIIIYNYKNQKLYSTDNKNHLKISNTLLDRVRLLDQSKIEVEGIRFTQDDYEVIAFLFTDTYDRFVVIAGAKDIYGLKKLRNLRDILIFVFIVSIIVVSIAGWIYAGRALKPIAKVIDQVNNITIGSLHLRLNEGESDDEISQLSSTFNRMLSRLERAFNMQKSFIANASHELRTPLTVLSGQLEVSLLKERSADEYRQTMLSVLEDMQSLNHTSNRLLILAQANSDSSRRQFTQQRLDDILWKARTDILKLHPDYSIIILFESDPEEFEQLTILGNEFLLKTAFSNLMENGCKYSEDKRIEVKINPQIRDITINFEDQGIGIEDEDQHHIFEPFHRGKNAISFKGHGIGLSLVERIVMLHDGKIDVWSKTGIGTRIKLSFQNLNTAR